MLSGGGTYEHRGAESHVETGPSFKDLLEIASRKKTILFAVTSIVVCLVAAYHFLYPSYKAKAYLLIDAASDHSGLEDLMGALGGRGEQGGMQSEGEDEKFLMSLESMQFYQRLATTLRSQPEFPAMERQLRAPGNPLAGISSAIRSLGSLLNRAEGVPDRDWLTEAIRPSKLAFKKKGIVEVVYVAPTRELTVFLTNHFLDTAAKLFSEREEKKLAQARDYIQGKIRQTTGNLEDTDKKIVGVNTKNASNSLLAPQSAIAEQLLKLKEELQGATFKFEQNKQLIVSLKSKSAEDSGQGVPESLYGVQRTVANLELENQILAIRIDTLKKGLDQLLKSNLNLPKEEQILADLKRNKGLDYYVFDNLVKTLLQIEVKGLSTLGRVYPLEHVAPGSVVKTMSFTSKILLSALLALVGTALLLYCQNFFNPVIRTKRDVEGLGASFLGTVPKISPKYFQALPQLGQFCHFDVESKETSKFRHLRSRLIYLSEHSGDSVRKVVCLLSYGNGEGKSFISSNLAMCFAHMGKRTLLIDFDIRRANLTKLFHLQGRPGLCAHLDRGEPLDDLIVRGVRSDLDVLPAGSMTSKTTERFSNRKFVELMEALKPKYDFIFVDTAPLVVAHESLAIAQDSDFAVLLTTSWKTKRDYFIEALEEIRNVRRLHIHFIVNQAQDIDDNLVNNYYYLRMGRGEAPAVAASVPDPLPPVPPVMPGYGRSDTPRFDS